MLTACEVGVARLDDDTGRTYIQLGHVQPTEEDDGNHANTMSHDTEYFIMGRGWRTARSDPDELVRRAARDLLLGVQAGKVRRVGVYRARRTPPLPARDGDVERLLDDLVGDAPARRAWRRRIRDAYDVTFDDVRTATRPGRPSRDALAVRRRVAMAFADIVDRGKVSAQAGRRPERRVLMLLYAVSPASMSVLLAAGRTLLDAAVTNSPPVVVGGSDSPTEWDDDRDESGGEDNADEGDVPRYDDRGHFRMG